MSACRAACLVAVSLAGFAGSALSAAAPPSVDAGGAATAQVAGTDSGKMEKQLQRLPWQQFRSVIEAVPKMKADVDAYGPLGWQYVQKNYATYGWKKNIDRLDDSQKKRLAELIQNAKRAR
ncbi:MAG: hypothetical protein PHY45_01750 [Rhodocyclaceae bacterium]|nr:hypothetical protein [Rhodocyclaceae bacterium]